MDAKRFAAGRRILCEMTRRFAVTLLSLVASFPLFAARPRIVRVSTGPDLRLQIGGSIGDPRESFDIQVDVDNDRPAVPANDLVLDLDFDGAHLTILHESDWTCQTNRTRVTCTLPALNGTHTRIDLTLRGDASLGGQPIRIRGNVRSSVLDFNDANNHVTHVTEAPPFIPVANVMDSGPGTLRAAITTANAITGSAHIFFEIAMTAPPSGWFTISPASPLPPVTNPGVIIDGSTQAKLTGDTNPNGPEVMLDGQFASGGSGLELAGCGGGIRGLTIANFPAAGISVHPPTPCLQGGSISITGNVISGNRRSGIDFGFGVTAAEVFNNVIILNREAGVAINRAARRTDIRDNIFGHNGGQAIDIGLDGPDDPFADDAGNRLPNPPLMLNAHYDASRDMTVMTGTLHSGNGGPYFNDHMIQLFANDTEDGEGEHSLGGASGAAFSLEVKGDYRGKWITAVQTRTHWVAAKPPAPGSYAGGESATSEFSNAVKVD
jgi:hypothetical protein